MTAATVDDTLPPEWSEIRLADRFVGRHANDWRYCAEFRRWLGWDGSCWRLDRNLAAFDLARAVCSETAAEALRVDPTRNKNVAYAIGRAATVAAVERLAKARREFATLAADWDADPWTLSTPGGLVDLRTGGVRKSDRSAFCTKSTAVSPGGDCPAWHRFLSEITAGDQGVQNYLQRVAGYALTGDSREHALFFVYGPGGNGKSVFVSVLQHIMDDYATQAPMETFTAQAHGDRHPTDLASLRGARLVVASETEEGRRWAESRIKQLTGGDKVMARFMRQDYFEYTPQFTLLIVGNHKPRISNVDEAMRRRLRLIPFNFKPERPDKLLTDKLKAEAGGILAWAIQGCLDWQRSGLGEPSLVSAATSAYFDDEDGIARWQEERTEHHHDAYEPVGGLYADWKDWAGRAEEFAGSQRRFIDQLVQRGYTRDRTSHGRVLRGLRLRQEVAVQNAANSEV